MVVIDDKTLFDEAGSAFDEILMLEQEIRESESPDYYRTDYESAEYIDLIGSAVRKNRTLSPARRQQPRSEN